MTVTTTRTSTGWWRTKTKKCQEVLERSLIKKTSNVQQIEMATQKGWKPSQEQADTNKRHMTHLLQTQAVEELIGHQKNHKGTSAINRCRRPLSAMLAGILSPVLTERHSFKTVSADIPLPKRSKLDAECFQADAAKQSLPFEELANYDAKAGHYSPKSENNNVQGAA